MAANLEYFKIKGLHGRLDFDLRFKNNVLIIVGENGSGKTTLLRILFLFLSGRWLPLAQFKFDSIEASVNGKSYKLTREAIEAAFRRRSRFLPPEIMRSIRNRIAHVGPIVTDAEMHREIAALSARYAIPPEYLEEYLLHYEIGPGKGKELRSALRKEFDDQINELRAAVNAQILYLPTYRRIERELASIFENPDSEEARRNITEHTKARTTAGSFVELVEFGMKDIDDAIARTSGEIKDFAREGLNNLTLKYLGDVVDREYETARVTPLSEETITNTLNRIDENILSKEHKRHLRGVISAAMSADKLTEHQKIIYHYFVKLQRFQESLEGKEHNITNFCNLCSHYIIDKTFHYDSATFSFLVTLGGADNKHQTTIKLSDLSSGEKQIVSLFGHLFLSRQNKYFVIIDEPELSLSVPWQQRFLVDIQTSAFCAGLFAATHSPFIYDNDLRPYARSISEFARLGS